MPYTLSSSPKGVHFNSTIAPSLRALLTGAIDYAGLFPPATLPLDTALKNHAEYLRSDEAWMLSTFVLPIGKFSGLSDHLGHFAQQYPLRISALVGKPEDGGGGAQRAGSRSLSEGQLGAALSGRRQLHAQFGRATARLHHSRARAAQMISPFFLGFAQ